MILEFLPPGGAPECPLIRLYRGTPAELEQLHRCVRALEQGDVEVVKIHELPGVVPIDGLQLTFRSVERNAGLVLLDSGEFEFSRARDRWDEVGDLIEGLLSGQVLEGSYSCQWLCPEGAFGVNLLLSTDWNGRW